MHLPPSWCSMFSQSSWVKDPFEMADVVDWTRLSIILCTHTESAIVDKGKMPHPSLGDRHPVPRVYQTSQGCYPLNWCFVEVYSRNYSVYIYICIYPNLPPIQYICSWSSLWFASSVWWPSELTLYSTLSWPDEIKQSHYGIQSIVRYTHHEAGNLKTRAVRVKHEEWSQCLMWSACFRCRPLPSMLQTLHMEDFKQ